ncbi:retinol dehydrogenase 12 [Teleopsis dalmanni]|uniref:retinol dehydrogenase 12 n=1 Tax=Teleopsis dalmanni TaxID=139649 RepID=UPI0018CE8B53|nr:retinol dehydrogenase 12 [Teleopsis dalmanni]
MTEDITVSPPEDPEKSLCFQGPWAWIILILLILGAIIFIMYLLRKCFQNPYYRKANRIDGKVVIITGCNTGIGKETALELAQRGAKIYMACRDSARCEAARLEIIQRTQNQQVYNRTLDLASLASVRQFAENFLAEEPRLDILINNAGLMATPRKLTADGFEQQFGVNHLGHFLLTNLLLERIKASAPSRIIVVSSAAHLLGRIYKNDINSEKSYSKFLGAYCQSKLANILFTRKLAEMLKDTKVTVNALHPGVVRTELTRYTNENSTCVWALIRAFVRLRLRDAKAGAQTTLCLALDPDLENKTGGYYEDCKPHFLPPWAKNKETAEWLWKESEKMVGLQPSDEISSVVVNP